VSRFSASSERVRSSSRRARSSGGDRGVLFGKTVLPVALITALAALLRFATIGRQSFWYDETVTVWLVGKPFGTMLTAIPSSESTPPLYYVITWVWVRLFGVGEAGVRSLSALAGTLTVAVAYAAGRRLVSHRAGLIAAALAAVSPFLVWYSQEARAYALVAFFSALSVLLAARAREAATTPAIAGWALSASFALATHYFAVFLVTAEALWLLLAHRHRRGVTVACGFVVVVFLTLLPLALHQERVGTTSWIHNDFGLRLRSEEALRQLVTFAPPAPWAGAGDLRAHALWLLAPVTLALALAALARFATPVERRGARIALALGAATVGVPFVIAVVASAFFGGRGDLLLDRNLIPAWLPLTILLASAAGARRAGRLGLAAAALSCAVSLSVTVVTAFDAGFQRENLRVLAKSLEGPEQAVIVGPVRAARSVEVYRPELQTMPAGGAVVREIDLVVRGPQSTGTLSLPSAFRPIATSRFHSWTLIRYRSSRLVRIEPRGLTNEVSATLDEFAFLLAQANRHSRDRALAED
jgi:mannosyltransferase